MQSDDLDAVFLLFNQPFMISSLDISNQSEVIYSDQKVLDRTAVTLYLK